MESSVAPLLHRRSHLPSRTYRSLLHFCSSFNREPRVSLATPAVLQQLVLRSEFAQVSLEEACEPGEACLDEKPPESLPVLESSSNRGSDESKAEKVETISQEKSLMLGDVFEGIDLQDASVSIQHNDFFDNFELMINESDDLVPESCVNLFEVLDVNDYDDDGIAKPPLDLVHNVVEKPITGTELQVDTTEGDKKVSESIGYKAEEAPKSVESIEVITSEVLETCNETLQREMELEKPVNSTQVLADSVSGIVEDDDVEEGEISGDDNDDMLVGDDDLLVESHDECNITKEIFDKRGEGAGNSNHTSHKSFGSSSFCGVGSLSTPAIVDENGQRQFAKELGVEASNIDNRANKSDQTSNKEEKMDLGTSIKKRSAPSKEAKARKKARSRKKRAQERIALGVKKLKLKPVAPKPKPIKYCRHYLKGRCHEGENCKFSHDTTPETKSSPCCYFATQSCMKGDDCPYDHDLSKYPCKNFITNGFCHRGDNCLFSHKGTPKSDSDAPSANVTALSTNIAAASFSSQISNKQTVREAIAKLPSIQARVSSSVAFLKPSSQSNQRNSPDALSPMINRDVSTPPQIPPFRKPSVAPKGMGFLSLDKMDTVKPSPGSKQNIQNSCNQSLKQSQHRSSLPQGVPKGISFLTFTSEEHKALNPNEEPQKPQEAESSRNVKTRPNSHIRNSLNSAMKLAAELETGKVDRRINEPAETVNKGDVTATTSVTRNSGNISSKILDFLSSFSNGKS